jgi:GT2 family glycosyltransferase
MSFSLSASIVVFDSDRALLRRTLEALAAAVTHAASAGLLTTARITIVDNDAAAGAMVDEPYVPDFAAPAATIATTWRRISGQGNVGFGRGHNLVLRDGNANAAGVDMHVVLNPDALLAVDALTQGLAWMRAAPACGMVAPNAAGPDGAPLFLCKRYPDVLTLLLRAAAPAAIRKRFAGRLARYELRDIVGEAADRAAQSVPLASGCCMLLRREAVRYTNGFDPAFFVYFEDYDMSLRLTQGGTWRIDYLPAMRLVHFGGNAARKSWAHIRLFAAGAIRFFNKHGWKLA